MVLAARSRGSRDGYEKVAQDLARDAAREQLRPLLETACARLACVLHRCFDIATESQPLGKGSFDGRFEFLFTLRHILDYLKRHLDFRCFITADA